MKKLFALLLSFVMVLSLAACGDDKEDKKEKESPSKTENVDSPSDDGNGETGDEDVAEDVEVSDELLSFLSQLSLVQPTDAIVGTSWEFSGGMLDGVEMDEAQAAQSLETYGGQLNIVFDDDENVSMVQGGGTLQGVYGVTADSDNVLGLIFADDTGNGVVYAGLFADVEGTIVLMLFPDGSGQNAIYFTQTAE